jgi:hypothetical protein
MKAEQNSFLFVIPDGQRPIRNPGESRKDIKYRTVRAKRTYVFPLDPGSSAGMTN